MGIWIVIVPVSAKILSNDWISEWNLSLPFTWYLFFFSALSFSVGNILFLFRCPLIVKENDSLEDFNREGKVRKHLELYASNISFDLQSTSSQVAPDSPIALRDAFWPIYFEAINQRKISRLICSCFYFIGTALAIYVIGENVVWVVKTIVFTH
ncbi:MAG: hypothetical protein AVO38_05490 [delta proteobacterium ML8_D]|nr:MAG: hypothetical protein AVO38_05490 [delta proteobacterium ML8_D]